jgi:hypothetical protein
MIEKDLGNATTQTIYELATKPTFVDRSEDGEKEISWEVADGEETPLPPENENINEEEKPSLEEAEERDQEPDLEIEEEVEEEPEKTEKKKKKNRTSEKNRISQLTRELRHAQAVAADVINRNQYLESKVTQKEKDNLTAQENYLTSQKERVKKYLTDAIEEGDPTKIAEANDLLGQYNAEILWLTRQKQNVEPELQEQQSYKKPSSEDLAYTSDHREAFSEWIENNPWANENSDDFDRDLHAEADEYSIKLMKKYTISGRKSEIGSSEFFDEISDYIHSKYEVENNPAPVPFPKQPSRDRMQMKTDKSPPVASVTRQGMQGTSPVKSKDIVLTPEQKETAYNMRGYVRDPKTGQKITDNRILEEIYKRNLMKGNG